MKKLIVILTLSVLTMTCLHSEDEPQETPVSEIKDRYGYYSYGFGLPALLNLNIGSRMQKGHNGFEAGIGVTPLVFIYDYHAFVSYLYYPKPSKTAESYIGLGLRGGYVNGLGNKWKRGKGYMAPGIIVGKNFIHNNKDKRFIQVAVSPVAFANGEFRFAQSINISYGFCF